MPYTGPDLAERPVADDEIHAWRQVGSPLPVPGEHVLYRHVEFGDITDALVVEVVPDDPQDITSRVGDHPWSVVLLRTGQGLVATREARVRGSAGWLPLSWLAEV